MQVVELDGARLLALMTAGAVFALAGLWLMFRRQPEGEAARIELFGLKVQASSAGLLVFLIGAAFLAVPIFVPERPSGTAAGGAGVPPRPEERTDPAPAPEGRPLQVSIETDEREPNDSIASANIVPPGSAIRGELGDRETDVFAVDVPEGTRGDVVASLSVAGTTADVELLDDAGKPMSSTLAGWAWGTGSVEQRIQRPRYFVVLRNREAEVGTYSLTVAVRE